MEDQPQKRGRWKLAIGVVLTVAIAKAFAAVLNESHSPLLVLLKFLVFWGVVTFFLWVIVLRIYRRIKRKRPIA